MDHADLVCLSHLRWGFVFQRPNHLMSLAARDRRVFFFEEPVMDDTGPFLEVRRVAPNLIVAVPHVAPGLSATETTRLQSLLLAELIAEQSIRDPVGWFYTPMAMAFADDIPFSLTVYDCMDELSAFHGASPRLRELEAKLFARADVVFTGGRSLFEAKRRAHSNVHAFPSSVDATHFAQARQGLREPDDQAPIPAPRIGYFGVIDERIDLTLLAAVADAEPSWHTVLVGPVVKIDPATLPQRPNIHYLGQKSYDELPSYVAGWDVAIMPFALNESTRYISPTKTLEYLAAGKPVVSTAIRDVVTPYGDRGLVAIADTGHSFVRAIAGSRAEDPAARTAKADAFVSGTSWDKTWQGMQSAIRAARGVRKVPAHTDIGVCDGEKDSSSVGETLCSIS